jgi:hypothetical protein
MKNLTYDQLIELAPKDRPFQIEVDGDIHWAFIDNGKMLRTLYTNRTMLEPFTLIDPRYTKPEVLKVGQKVRILDSARDIKEYGDMIGKIMTIHNARSDAYGVHYTLDNNELGSYLEFPHYCVQPVEEEEKTERTLRRNVY